MKKRRRIIIIALVSALLIASVSLAAAMMIPSAEDLLVRSLENMEQIEDAHVIAELNADLPADLLGSFSGGEIPESVSATFELWGKLEGPVGQPAFRFELLEASEEALIGLTAVSDGSQFWLYAPSRDLVVTGQFEQVAAILQEKMSEYEGMMPEMGDHEVEMGDHPETPADAVAKLLEYVTADRQGQDELAAGEADLIRLLPIAEQMPEQFTLVGGYVNLWLRASDYIPLAVEFDESALAYARLEATTAEINTDFEDAIFTFDLPEGAIVMTAEEIFALIEAKAGLHEQVEFEALSPAELPDGATASEPQKVAGALVQRYGLPGDKSFYIAQGSSFPLDPPSEASSPEKVVVRGVEGTLFSNDEASRTLLAWNEGELFFVVGGDLSPDQALAIAESLQ